MNHIADRSAESKEMVGFIVKLKIVFGRKRDGAVRKVNQTVFAVNNDFVFKIEVA